MKWWSAEILMLIATWIPFAIGMYYAGQDQYGEAALYMIMWCAFYLGDKINDIKKG